MTDTPQLTSNQFRDAMPVFQKPEDYGDEAVKFWLQVAYLRLPASRWRSMLTTGVVLFTAHNLVLEKQAEDARKRGGDPGLKVGALSSQSVGDVSVNYDVSITSIAGAGHWNKTTYGTRFWELARIVGAGPIQIGIGSAPPPNSGPGWSGPPIDPGWLS